MNLKSLRTFLTVALVATAGQSWAAPSLPADGDPTWQNIPDNNSANGGIQWSINGGAWQNVGGFGSSTYLYVGDTVQFKVTLHKDYDGNHYADLVKAWVDWDKNQSYSNTSEVLLQDAHVVTPNANTPWHTDNYVNQSFAFLSGSISVNAGMLGDHYVLARAVCTDTLLSTKLGSNYGGYGSQWNYSLAQMEDWFSPTANYAANGGQGDSDQVKFTVKTRSVPEPGSLALFAVAMLGVSLNRKRAKGV